MKPLKTIPLLFLLFNVFIVQSADSFTLKNDFMERTVSVKNGIVATHIIKNKRNATVERITNAREFVLQLSHGVEQTDPDILLTNADFKVYAMQKAHSKTSKAYVLYLQNTSHGISMVLRYELGKHDFFCRKSFKITFQQPYTLERVELESMSMANAWQPYTTNKIYAYGEWKPNLGQPLYSRTSALFFGVEFPASINVVANQSLSCGYQVGTNFKAKETYSSYSSVIGAADDTAYIDECFYDYIASIRKRPLRLQVQYNSWFDFGPSVNSVSFQKSISTIHRELVEKRKCKPLNAYVIDDGWQKNDINQCDSVWQVNAKFDWNFATELLATKQQHSNLGLWLSPGCFFGSKPMVESFRKMGYEALSNSMSLTGPKYMEKLDERVLQLCQQGVNYFKFDGLFGHLFIRDFELQGRGTPAMPQLQLSPQLAANDPILNSADYNELKMYYLTKGSEQLMSLFTKMSNINPEVFIAITNGAYLSPWWLQYADVVWLINAADAAAGNNRTAELVYRDNIYYTIWKTENTKFPINAIFNHEPKKTAKNIENPAVFTDYLLMNLSRGTGFVELYIKTESLKSSDWDALANSLNWAYYYFQAFKHVNMLGGSPKLEQVYGYTGHCEKLGYVSLHNPSDSVQTYKLTFNRTMGLRRKSQKAVISNHHNWPNALGKVMRYADTLSITLASKQIVLLGYDIK